jgi:hypothetical protein
VFSSSASVHEAAGFKSTTEPQLPHGYIGFSQRRQGILETTTGHQQELFQAGNEQPFPEARNILLNGRI